MNHVTLVHAYLTFTEENSDSMWHQILFSSTEATQYADDLINILP